MVTIEVLHGPEVSPSPITLTYGLLRGHLVCGRIGMGPVVLKFMEEVDVPRFLDVTTKYPYSRILRQDLYFES